MSPVHRRSSHAPRPGLTLDTGALIALERRDRPTYLAVAQALDGPGVRVPAGVVAQAWRDGRRQPALASLVRDPGCRVVGLDLRAAQAVGELCGATRSADVVDAAVVLCARAHGDVVLTSDPGDLRRLDPGLAVVTLADLSR